MAAQEAPQFVLPSDHELEVRLSASVDMDDRVAYVKALFAQAGRINDLVRTLDRERQHAEGRAESMQLELRALRQKHGGLTGGEKVAVDQRNDMINQMRTARAALDRFKRDQAAAVAALEEALRAPRGQ